MTVQFVLTLLLIWAGLCGFLLLAINRYRDSLEAQGADECEVIARIQANGLRRVHRKEKP